MTTCPFESRILQSREILTPEVREHVAGCPACRTSSLIAESLRAWATKEGAPFAPARFLWLAAEDRKIATHAARLQVGHSVAVVMILIGLLFAAWRLGLFASAAIVSVGIFVVAAIVFVMAIPLWGAIAEDDLFTYGSN